MAFSVGGAEGVGSGWEVRLEDAGPVPSPYQVGVSLGVPGRDSFEPGGPGLTLTLAAPWLQPPAGQDENRFYLLERQEKLTPRQERAAGRCRKRRECHGFAGT